MTSVTQDIQNKEICQDVLKNVKKEMLEQVTRHLHDRKIKRHKKSKTSKLNLLSKLDKKEESKRCKKHSRKKSIAKHKLRKKKIYNSDENDETSSSSNNSSDSDFEVRINKKTKQSKKNKPCIDSISSSYSSEEYEWVEAKSTSVPLKRDTWMTEPVLVKTYTKEHIEKKPNETYDPAKSSLELNSYWKTTGTGLPNFQQPCLNDDGEKKKYLKDALGSSTSIKNWKKTNQNIRDTVQNINQNPSKAKQEETLCEIKSSIHLSDQEMNELSAKIIKAEIMGDLNLAKELKQQLDYARQGRATSKETKAKNRILLTHTDVVGNSRPIFQLAKTKSQFDSFDNEVGEHMRHRMEDKRCNLQEIYLREKYTTPADTDRIFLNIAKKQNGNFDDLDDIFTDHINKNRNSTHASMQQSIKNQQRVEKILDSCNKCIDSSKMQKQLLVSLGQRVYLALPWHVGLQADHCIIAPNQHILCSTQLDEDAWLEVTAFRKTLTRMFADQKKDVIFYEIANHLNKKPHLTIHCVPIDQSKSEMAPFYFKKAIEESEREWSVNKQLISLKDKCLLKCVPKGLPYFWVHFNMNSGFAHIIEDEDRFPPNFAQEIIGGILRLESNCWRKLHKERDNVLKTKMFKESWEKYC